METIPNNTTNHSYADLERLAKLMDDRFHVLGFNFGLNFIIDLIPGVGDIVTTMVALYIFSAALRYKVSKFTVFRMLINIGIYFIVGLLPWVGDVFGAWWKPNRRNLNLVRRNLDVA